MYVIILFLNGLQLPCNVELYLCNILEYFPSRVIFILGKCIWLKTDVEVCRAQCTVEVQKPHPSFYLWDDSWQTVSLRPFCSVWFILWLWEEICNASDCTHQRIWLALPWFLTRSAAMFKTGILLNFFRLTQSCSSEHLLWVACCTYLWPC